MKEAKRTPGEWRDEWLDEDNGWIMDAAGNYIAEMVTEDDDGKLERYPGKRRANAAFIAKACNSFDGLVEALRDLVRRVERDNLHTTHGVKLQAARAALARVEGDRP